MEEVDLFNNLQNIVITNAGKDVWQQIGKVNLNAHNPNPGAPEHLAMVNNLLGDNADKKPIHETSNLENISQPQWRGLRNHVLTLSHPMTRCCFQCGMMNHPAAKGSEDIIIVDDIHELGHCRAYRVFKYYIKKLVSDRCERLGPDASDAEMRSISKGTWQWSMARHNSSSPSQVLSTCTSTHPFLSKCHITLHVAQLMNLDGRTSQRLAMEYTTRSVL